MAIMYVAQIGGCGGAHFRNPATQDVLHGVATALGHALPRDLHDLLRETDGVEGEYGLGLVWSAERIASDNVLFRTDTNLAQLYMPFSGLVFFADAGNGDQFFLSLSGNREVYVWDHESDSRTWVASTVLGYLQAWMSGELTI
jgi:hypothetical protein